MNNWFVVMSKPGKQEEAYKKLSSNPELLVFNPKIKQYSTKRSQYIVQPLFPMYLFVKFNIEKHLRMIKYTRGVLKILGAPTSIPDTLVENIKQRSDESGIIQAKYSIEEIKKGDKVRIINGPLEGIETVVSGLYNEQQRVEILMDLMRIVINKDHITKL
jgi:transcription antitermination factor NusG